MDLIDPKMEGYVPLDAYRSGDHDHPSRVRDAAATRFPQKLVLSPQALDFGNIGLTYTSPVHTVLVSNQGYEPLTIAEVTVVGSGFLVGPVVPTEIRPQETLELQVFFAPTRLGAATGAVYVNSGDAAGQELITLSGSGIPALDHTPIDRVIEYVDGLTGTAIAARDLAAQSAQDALNSAQDAEEDANRIFGQAEAAAASAGEALEHKNAARDSAGEALTAKQNAETARDFASRWASAPTGQQIDDGINPADYSAFHWAKVAEGAASGALPDGGITEPKMADASISRRTIVPEAVDDSKIADEAVTEAKIAPNAVTTDKIPDQAVIEAKLAEAVVEKLNPTAATLKGKLDELRGGLLPIVDSVADTTTDWQSLGDTVGWHSSVISGNAPNGPGGSPYYFALTMRRATGSSKAILAIPRHADMPVQILTWNGSEWLPWRKLAWSDEVVSKAGDTLQGGYTATATDDGVKVSGTYRPTPVGGNLCRTVNGGAFTLAAPTAAGDYTLIVQISNQTGAGAITLSGFTKVTGDNFTLTATHKFMVFMTRVNGLTHAHVTALQ